MHPQALQNTLLIFLRHLLIVQTRLQTEETKGQDTQGNSTLRTGMVDLFTHSFVRDYAFFHPWKRVSFLYFDWSGLHFLAI